MIFLISLIPFLGSCGQPEKGYSIRVNLEGIDGQWIELLAREGREYVVVDSVLAEEGTPAVMSDRVDGVRTMYLRAKGKEGSIRFLLENAQYEISGTLSDPVIISDSKAQNDLNEYSAGKEQIISQMTALRNQLVQLSEADRGKADSLRDAYYALYDTQTRYDTLYVSGHPDSYASVLALRENFYLFDNVRLEAALTSLAPPLHQMEEYQFMQEKLDRMKGVAIGKPYTDFGLKTPEGGLLRVSDVHNGDVLLIDFWASWCGPCRRANPELVEIYNEYHDKGLQILGVSLDRDSANWVKAIADDHLTWSHISDLKFWDSEGANLYGVSAIPHSVLINRDGIIVANDLSGQKLKEAIESLL
jgi:thiol-disulfide isomerase/thioredoxin